MRVVIISFERAGLIVRPSWRGERLTISYGEILTAERRPRARGLVLHTRTVGDVRLAGLRRRRLEVESKLRARGVRVVDCWGRPLSPHQLRHGFANRFLRESGRDVVALQALMGHSRPDTTQQYTDEIAIGELSEALASAADARRAQALAVLATDAVEAPEGLESLRWRRRESNPRPQPHRAERLQA